MERLHFETLLQKVETEVIKKTINNKYKDYDYKAVKLPATFIEEKTTLWWPKKRIGKHYIAEQSGGSARIILRVNDFPGIRIGDKLIATFKR